MLRASLFARLAAFVAVKASPGCLRSTRLRLEPLEDRKLLTTSPVYVNDDWVNLSSPDVPPQVGDLVTDDANDPNAIQAVYGVNAFGKGSGQSVAGYGLIRDAIANTNSGGLLIILAGTYAESDIVVNKAITIHGAGQSGAAQTLIVPEAVSNQSSSTSFGVSGTHNGFILYSAGITIENLSLDGSGNGALAGGYHYHQGITTLYDTQNGSNVATLHDGGLAPYNIGDDFLSPAELTIRDLTVRNTWFHGITISGIAGQVISNNSVHNVNVSNVGTVGSQDLNRIGILLQNTDRTQVVGSHVSAAGVGIATNPYAIGIGSFGNYSGVLDNTVTDAVLRGYSIVEARGQFSLNYLVVEGEPFIGFDNNVAKFNSPSNNATGLYLNHSQSMIVGFTSDGAKIGIYVENTNPDDNTVPLLTGDTLIGPGSGVVGSIGILAQNSFVQTERVNITAAGATTISGYETGIKINQIVAAANGVNVAQIDRVTISGNSVGINVGAKSVVYGSLQMTDPVVGTSASTLTPGYPLSPYMVQDGTADPVVFAGPQPGLSASGGLTFGSSATFAPILGPTVVSPTTTLFNFDNSATYELQPLPPGPESGTISLQYSTSWDDGQVVQDGNGQLVIDTGALNGPLRLLYGVSAHPQGEAFAFDPINIHDRNTVNIVAKAGAANESLAFLFGLVDYDGDISTWTVPFSAFNSTAYSTHSINLLAPGIPLSLGGDGTFDLSRVVGYAVLGDAGLLNGDKNTPFSLILDEINASTVANSQVIVTGGVNLGSATLGGALVPGFTPTLGQQFTLIDNDNTDAVVGTFAGIGQNGYVTLSGQAFQVNYSGGTGNDVVLTRAIPPAPVNIAVGNVAVAEGNAGQTPLLFTVSLSNTTPSNVTVRYATSNGTALTSNLDYSATSGTLTFTPGQTTQVVTVIVRGDTTVESNETFNLNLSNASNNATIAGATGIGTINNDDVANISISNVTANEGNAGTTPFVFTISLSAMAAANVTVRYATADGTATTADGDYNGPTSTVTFTPGEFTKVVTVQVNGDTTNEPDETFTVNLSNATNGVITGATGTATITNDDGPKTIVGRRVFYNQSKFDGNGVGANTSDDLAIASDKVALLPGSGQATFSNITSYTRGINGIMIDFSGTPVSLTASDFIFKVGANNTPSLWASPLGSPTITVRPGAGTGGSNRVEVIFTAANAPKNQWLEVTVKGNDARGGFNTNTGLAVSDVFYFGNRVGDDGTGTTNQAITTFVDENAARSHIGAALVTNVWDYDRSGLVSATDGITSRFNAGTLLKISIANPPAAPEAIPAVAISGNSAENAIITALAANNRLKVDTSPAWIHARLQKLELGRHDLNASLIGKFIANVAHDGVPRPRAIQNVADKLTDQFAVTLDWDDSLLDDLLT